ncbi:MAG: hypothetical protein HY432_00490 [Candidatus Liptonbacteria bacterium]|nr:hypothetical protein [Candidatus Liptonbacteria bacterium]
MKASGKAKQSRVFSDIHPAKRPKGILGRLHDLTVNLKPSFYKKHRFTVLFMAVILVFGSAFTIRHLLIRAEVANFYAGTCLGTWQTPSNAQGEPETEDNATSSELNSSNSAFYKYNDAPQGDQTIFCGSFIPSDFEAEGDVKNVALNLFWQVGVAATSSEQQTTISGDEQITDSQTPVETVSSTTSSTGLSATSSVIDEFSSAPETSSSSETVTSPAPSSSDPVPPAEQQPVSTSTATSTPANSSSTTSFLFDMFSKLTNRAFAQEVSSTIPVSSSPDSFVSDSATTSSGQASTTTTTNSTTGVSVIFMDSNSSDTASSTPVPSDSAPQTGETKLIQDPVQDKSFADISYSTDGQNWISFRKVNPDNWRDLNLTIPLSEWEDLKKLQIQVRILPTSGNPVPDVYIDGMLLEVNYELPSEILGTGNPAPNDSSISAGVGPNSQATTTQIEIIVLPTSTNPLIAPQGTNFGADESPSFQIDLNELPLPTSTNNQSSTIPSLPAPSGSTNTTSSGAPSFLKATYGMLSSATDFFLKKIGLKFAKTSYAATGIPFPDENNPVVSRVYGPNGKVTAIQPMTVLINNVLHINIPPPGRDFKPGVYGLELWIWKNGSIYYASGDFSWGVLVVNFNKSIYTSGDKINVGFGVLDNYGHTICDANIKMTVQTPSGKMLNFSTQNKTITRNSTCGPTTVTNKPDYSAVASSSEIGVYGVKVTAQMEESSNRAPREITDSFEVQQNPFFDVERRGPTRIYPPEIYQFTIRIKANQDFSGVMQEAVPSSFNIPNDSGYSLAEVNGEKIISWNVNLKSGESQEVRYSFKAPDISPELYKLGPLRIGAWQESRQWQIAADAAGDMIFLWDGASSTIPNGWTCLNCSAGDPFYGVYPRASSTPGNASSSRDTFTFSMTFNNASSGTTQQTESNTSRVVSLDTHTHSWQNLTATLDVRPSSKNLYFISAASTTTSLPNGIIGMFDATSTANLPASWSAYDPLNSSTTTTFLRGGEDATSTVGSTNRGVSVGQWTSGQAATTTTNSGRTTGTQVTVGTDGHTHTQLATTTSFGATNPPAIGVVFAKLSTTSTIPNGIIAMFDNSSLPDNWNSVSTSGSAFAGNLIVGTSSFTGASFGSATFSDSGTFIYTSGIPDTTETWRTGTVVNLNNQTHTHEVAYTYSVASTSSLPVYRDVILGKFTAPAETISCAASTLAVDFGTIDSNAIYTASPNASTSMSCNGGLGCTLYVNDNGSSTTGGGLYSSTTINYLIKSPNAAFNATATLAAGTDGFGIQATTTTAGSGGTLTVAVRYLQNGNTVGGLTTTTLDIASSTAAATDREVVITHKAAVGQFAIAGTYADTITYSCLSN